MPVLVFRSVRKVLEHIFKLREVCEIKHAMIIDSLGAEVAPIATREIS